MLVSTRRLGFTSRGMYFQCNTANYLETIQGEEEAFKERSYPGPIRRTFPNFGSHVTFGDLIHQLQEYFQRELTFGTDTIDAFEGAMQAYNTRTKYRHREEHFCGIMFNLSRPVDSFLHNLGWVVQGAKECPVNDSEAFPSWSWAAAMAKSSRQHRGHLYIPGRRSFVCPGATVQLRHQKEYVIDFETFVTREDDHLQYFPRLEISAWTKAILTTTTTEESNSIELFGTDVEIESLLNGELMALCLSVDVRDQLKTSWVQGLLVIDTGSSTYHRVQPFQCTLMAAGAKTYPSTDAIPRDGDHIVLRCSKGCLNMDFLRRECVLRTITLV